LTCAVLALACALPSPAPAQEEEAPAGPVLTRPPELVTDAIPVYPPDAIEAGIEGDVIVQIVIAEGGSVSSSEVVQGVGHGLDEAAAEAALSLVFTPAEVDGAVSAIGIRYTFSFRLADARATSAPEPTGVLAGEVSDATTGALLSGVSVSLGDVGLDTVTDVDGRFELRDVPAGALTVVLFRDDYHRLVEHLDIGPGERIEVASSLAPKQQTDNRTVVRGRKPWREVERAPLSTTPSTVTSHYSLTRRDIDFTPGGMEDVIQAVGRQPGVVGDPHYGQFWIRGGDSTETGFYLDRVALYNPFHLAGFNSVFNPELMDTAEIYLGAPPATYRDSLSGVIDVRYIDGTPGRWDGTIDVSTATAKAYLSGTAGPRKRSTFVIGARRTYFEPIFAVMRSLGLIGQYFLTPQFGEGFARYVARPGPNTRLRLSAVYTDDLIHFEEGDEDEDPLFEVKGKLRMKNRTFLLWGDWLVDGPQGGSLATTVSYMADRSQRDQQGSFDVSDDTLFRRLGGRMDARARLAENHFLSAGLDVGYVELLNEGEVLDERFLPTWSHLPVANYGSDLIHVEPRLMFGDGAVYVEDDWQGIIGGLDARVGVRWSFANPTGQQLLSPRLGLAYSFPTRTTIKLATGLYHQPPLDPLLLDPTHGNPDIGAERNLHAVLAVDQLLPFGALIRIEGYYKWMDHLVVNPDNREDVERGITYTNDGTGWAAGLDTSFQMRTGRVGALAQYSLLFTERTNPLNRYQPTTYAPPQDQRHTVLVGGNVVIGPQRAWIVSLSYQFHTGRPNTPVTPVLSAAGDSYEFQIGEVNADRYGAFHEINLRSEIHKTFKWAKLTWYVEVLNVTNFSSEFLYIWGDATTDEEGNLQAPHAQDVLPPADPAVGGAAGGVLMLYTRTTHHEARRRPISSATSVIRRSMSVPAA